MKKSGLIILGLVVGLFFPAAQEFSFLIRPFLMILLFFSFLGVKIGRSIFYRQQWYAAALLPLLALLAYWAGSIHGTELGLLLFAIALAPTAIISPVIAGIMRRDAGYLVGAILITHGAMALVLPFLIPAVLGEQPPIGELVDLFLSILVTIAVPLIFAQLIRRFSKPLFQGLTRVSPWFFALFVINVFIASAKLSHYLRYGSTTDWSVVWLATGAVGLLCVINFVVGGFLLPPGQRVEGSLALGRKNTMLAIWIALAFLGPLATLGPMLYILWQNAVMAAQVSWLEKNRPASSVKG
jgi:BASS family bile acid:Na+ symporter